MSAPLRDTYHSGERPSDTVDYVTVVIEDQLFGLPIAGVHDVFIATEITPVPLAPPEIAGLINLRGRVVTAVSLRRLLRLPDAPDTGELTVVGVEVGGESFGLVVDHVGEVLNLPAGDRQPNPLNLDPRWARLSRGIHWIDGGLLVVVDIEAALDHSAMSEPGRGPSSPSAKGSPS
jgi:purine-binding chemotaxis protein CheW